MKEIQISSDKQKSFKEILGSYLRQYILVIFLFILGIFLSFYSPNFLNMTNIMNILRQISFVGIAAIGMTIIIISGGIDLSIGGIAAFAGIITSSFFKDKGISLPVSILCGLAVGALLGFVNGFSISKLNIPPFIQTLVMMNFAQGMAYVYTKAQPIHNLPQEMRWLATSFVGPIPLLVIIMIFIYLLFSMILSRTVFGRRIYAIGGNVKASKYSGINTDRIRISVYTIMGLLAGLVGILLAARVTAGDPNSGSGLALDAIAATVMGGTSMAGGIGNVTGTVIGAILIGVIDNALVLLNFNPWWQPIVKAVVIFVAVLFDKYKQGDN